MATRETPQRTRYPFVCPINAETCTKGGTRIKCHICKHVSSTWNALITHLESQHDCDQTEMRGHYILEKAINETIAKHQPQSGRTPDLSLKLQPPPQSR